MRRLITRSLLMTMAMGAAATVGAGETITYKGTGSATTSYALLPLSSGGAAVLLSNSSVATIEPSEKGFMDGECAGLGNMGPDNVISDGRVICTFDEGDGHSFDLKGEFAEGKGEVEVIGGSGKWKDATGTGTFKRKWVSGNRSTFEYEFKISTP